MRLLSVAESVTALGGVTTVIRDIADSLSKSGHHSSAIGLDALKGEPGNAPRLRSLATAELESLRHDLLREVREHKPDIVSLHSPSIVAWAIPQLQQYRVWAHYHGSFSYAQAHPQHLTEILTHYSQAEYSIFSNQPDANGFRKAGLRNAISMPYPVSGIDSAPSTIRRPKTLLAVGRLSREKQWGHAMRAFAAAAVPQSRLVIVGDGPEGPSLKREAKTLTRSIESTIEFVGVADALQLRAWLRGSRALVVTSEFEGYCLTVSEAAAQELPTIAYACSPGVELQIIDGLTGTLLPPGDEGALKSAMSMYLDYKDISESRGRAARLYALKRAAAQLVQESWDAALAGPAEATERHSERVSSPSI